MSRCRSTAVKRAVWERDGGHCTFPLANGEICGSTSQLEFDHVNPKSQGGKATVENTRLRCKFHNLVEARRVLGDEVMDRYTHAGRSHRGVAPSGRDAARELGS